MNFILQNIRAIRESKHLSQEYIAISLQMTQSSYAKLESGQSKLTVERLILLADIFQISSAKLLDPNFSIYAPLSEAGHNH
jgi:transcriptional regulator with XRE-family HTH domain